MRREMQFPFLSIYPQMARRRFVCRRRQFVVATVAAPFNRLETLSDPFVIPVQIGKFNPELEKQRAG
jgi:hypothetical protein